MADNNTPGGQQNQGGQQKPTLSWSQPAVPAKPVTNGAAKPAAPALAKASVAQSTSSMGTYIGIFVAGIIAGALIGWAISYSGNKGGTVSTTASSTSSRAAETSDGSTNTVSGSNTATPPSQGMPASSSSGNISSLMLAPVQQAGFAVTVDKVTVTQPTWLVVYEDRGGTAGNAIGAALFFPGNTSGTIQLLRATLPGQSYLVGQSLDDGDKSFSLSSDKPVRDSKGNPLFTQFTAK